MLKLFFNVRMSNTSRNDDIAYKDNQLQRVFPVQFDAAPRHKITYTSLMSAFVARVRVAWLFLFLSGSGGAAVVTHFIQSATQNSTFACSEQTAY